MSRQSRDPYFNGRRAKQILVTVFLLHLAIIVLPLIFASLTEHFEPRIIVMNVGMADLPAGDSLDSGDIASSELPAPANEAELPPVESLQDPTPPPELPPEVKQPEPITTTQAKTLPPQEPPKTQPKTNPQPKAQAAKDPPKPPKYLSANEINVNRNTRTQAQLDAEHKAREAAEAKAKADAKEREALIAALRNVASQGASGTPNPGREGILATKEMRDYYDRLVAFLQPQWIAVSPSNIELGGKVSTWPVIDLTIAKDGTVNRAVIIGKSGNKAVDDSVSSLLAKLKVVPVPPQACTIRITLEIR